MDSNSILLGGSKELVIIREKLEKQIGLEEGLHGYIVEKQSLEKEIAAEEKLVQDTIKSTIKKRKDELESGFDKQINNSNSRLKEIRNKRENSKSKAIDERINKETQEVRNENAALRTEIRETFKQNKIPRFCDSTLYYALYNTGAVREFIIFALFTIIFIAIIPNLTIYFFIERLLWKVLLYIGIIVFVLLVYFSIYKLTKAKNKEIFEKMRPLRNKIRKNKKQIKRTKKLIKKDNDESLYDLKEYNDEIYNLEGLISNLHKEKEAASKDFDDTTAKVITNEIVVRNEDKIKQLKEKNTNLTKLLKEIEDKQRDLTLNITTDYEAYMGKEFMTLDMIDKLTVLINEEQASTISEAMSIIKGHS